MSIWTHITGIVYTYPFGDFSNSYERIIGKAFGKTVSYRDPRKKWKECTVPCGSEGSIQYVITRGKDTGASHCNGKTRILDYEWLITIWGNLRDYDSPEKIIQWIKKSTEKLEVRQGLVEVYCERTNDPKWLMVWDETRDAWMIRKMRRYE